MCRTWIVATIRTTQRVWLNRISPLQLLAYFFLYLHPHTHRCFNHWLTLMLLVANLVITKWCKKMKNDLNHGVWVLVWEYSARAFHWIPTWQALNGFQNFLHFSPMDKSNLSMERINQKSWQNNQLIIQELVSTTIKSAALSLGYNAIHIPLEKWKWISREFFLSYTRYISLQLCDCDSVIEGLRVSSESIGNRDL